MDKTVLENMLKEQRIIIDDNKNLEENLKNKIDLVIKLQQIILESGSIELINKMNEAIKSVVVR